MENASFLFAAYSATWVVLFIYVYSLWRKQNRVEQELQRLKDKMAEQGSSYAGHSRLQRNTSDLSCIINRSLL
jgi:CcmD family protein